MYKNNYYTGKLVNFKMHVLFYIIKTMYVLLKFNFKYFIKETKRLLTMNTLYIYNYL